MKRAIHLSLTVALLLMGGLAGPTGARAQTVQLQSGLDQTTLEILKDGAVVIESEVPFLELSIGNPDIADISTVSDRAVYVVGKQPGQTTLIIFSADGGPTKVVEIKVIPDVAELRLRLAEILPGESIQVRTANDGIVLSGAVSSTGRMEQALELAQRYAPDRVSNLMAIEEADPIGDIDELRDSLAEALAGEDIQVRAANDGIVLSGTLSSPARMEQALELAQRYAPDRVSNLMAVEDVEIIVDIDAFRENLQKILPDEGIEALDVSGGIVLTGNVSSNERMQQALQLALIYAPDRVTNLMTVPVEFETPNIAQLAESIQEILPDESIQAYLVGGSVVLSGTVSTPDRMERALGVAQLYAPRGRITNLMSVKQTCAIRTRRGAEVLETPVPCANTGPARQLAPGG